MIKIRNLFKSFDREVISDFSIEFESSSTSVILGPSGCGKTTLFNILSGLDREYEGEVSIDERISYIFQEDRLIPWLTCEENLKFIHRDASAERIDEVLDTFHLLSRKHTAAGDLSGGEKQRLSIGRAFLHDSPTILMDEALRSMDLSLKMKIIGEINEALSCRRKTLLVISHDIREALLLADTIYVMAPDPMTLIEKIAIEVPKNDRTLYDERILSIEKKLYKLLL